MGAVDWRREGSWHKRYEVYLNCKSVCLQRANCDATTKTLWMGMPESKLGRNDNLMMQKGDGT
ncbi:hypothetical protein PsorP6_007024 [Peronosclerospora sorghi]|uniref:Uncharacterized protein n=1 Tax=Peronosclerospora sorghi TaxID=230839 RepID=A0ACC0W9P3_9STRA|nr:hypothetical protein PsorP6_007024 [Peronosclerospora sorghi]